MFQKKVYGSPKRARHVSVSKQCGFQPEAAKRPWIVRQKVAWTNPSMGAHQSHSRVVHPQTPMADRFEDTAALSNG